MGDTTWTKEQMEVIAARDCNLIVAAAAGAGKTAVLVERIIQKITSDPEPIDIDKLLVVTFTNAAATEMRERIAQAISAALENNPESRQIQRQLTLLNKASITTIHSFCLEVIRSHFHELDIDPGFRIADETEASLMKMEVLQELFEEQYEDVTGSEDFFELLEWYGGNRDDQVIQEMVLNLYHFTQSSPQPEKWLKEMADRFGRAEEIDFATTPWGKVLLESVKISLEGIKENMSRAVDIILSDSGLDRYLPVFSEELSVITKIVDLCTAEKEYQWDEFFGTFQSLEFNKLSPAGKDADKEKQEYVKTIRDDTKKRLGKIKDRYFWADSDVIWSDLQKLYSVLQSLTRLVLSFSEKYAAKKRDKSIVDFNDLEHYSLQILTHEDEQGEMRPSKAALGYKERFAEILVDEYQDINFVQEVIIKMIAKDQPAVPNVFMVGDVKQSIYRFRQAKPELFLEKYHTYSLQKTSLYRKILLFKNFRSRQEVVSAVNFLFKQIMSVTAGELDYTDEEALNPGAVYEENLEENRTVGGTAEFHLIETGDRHAELTSELGRRQNVEDETEEVQGGDDTSQDDDLEEEMLDSIQCEARLVARRIRELMQPDDEGRIFSVYDKRAQRYREVAYKDIVILLRTTKNWAEVFQEELAGAGIPAFADTGTGFFRTAEIQVILSLLQVIDNPLQDIPLLAVLRSPLFSFTTDDLAELRLTLRKGPLYDALQTLADRSNSIDTGQLMSDQALETVLKAASFVSKLRQWQEMSFYMSTDQLLWHLYTDTGYFGIVGAMPNGEQRKANLRILFERARQYEETSYKGLFNFINFIDKLKSSKGDMGSAKILGENDNVVRIMSIHKSKGLEFPVVILAGCGKKFNLQDMNKSILLHQELGFGPDVVDHRLRLAYPSLPKEAIREKIKSETLSEEMRILYVALTRAREKLIVTGAVSNVQKAVERWNACTAVEGDKLPAYEIIKGERYLDWIAPALLRYPETSDWTVRTWGKRDVYCRRVEDEMSDDFLTWLDGLDSISWTEEAINPAEERNDYNSLLQVAIRKLSWEYPYSKISRVPAKVSVTELKRRFEEEQEPQTRNIKMKKPLFLENKKGLNAAEAGTAMHFVMQHLDLRNSNVEEQIKQMVEKDLLTREQAASVDPDRIDSFFNSLLGKRMLLSEIVQREVPFNLELPCGEVFREVDGECYQGESVLLQGVIDCFFAEPDGLVLIDYKTDFVPENGMEVIAERYRTQIQYYVRALEALTGKRVKEKYIYLFDNSEIIRY